MRIISLLLILFLFLGLDKKPKRTVIIGTIHVNTLERSSTEDGMSTAHADLRNYIIRILVGKTKMAEMHILNDSAFSISLQLNKPVDLFYSCALEDFDGPTRLNDLSDSTVYMCTLQRTEMDTVRLDLNIPKTYKVFPWGTTTCPKCHKSDQLIPIRYGYLVPIDSIKINKNGDTTIVPGTITRDDNMELYGGCGVSILSPNWHCKRDNINF